MRAKLDITEVEADTKIRGKYLRALENEEWGLLPGPTFVRSFLRTYGDYLGIDGRMLVEEFKLRHEGYDDQNLPPLGTPRSAGRDRTRRGAPRGRTSVAPDGRGRLWLVLGLVAVLVGGLFVLGTCGSSDDKTPRATPSATETTPASSGATLRIVARQPVYACLRGPDGQRLIDGVVLRSATPAKTYRASMLRLSLGTGSATLVVNGKPYLLRQTSAPRGYVIDKGGLQRVAAGDRVACG
jgi:hypothetical protein